MTLHIERLVFIHYFKFLCDDSGQDVVRIGEFEVELGSCSSEGKLFTSPVQFHFEGVFSSIGEDDLELVYIIVRALQWADC